MSHGTFTATQAKDKLKTSFLKKGLFIATISGMSYGLYIAFITLAMSVGIWEEWYGDANVAALSVFTIFIFLSILANAINYSVSAIWGAGFAAIKGKMRELRRSLKTKPGRTLVIAALVGGPISGSAFVIALMMAGPIATPITALCPAIGAIFSRIFFKQKLNARMIGGIIVCVIASFLIGMQGLGADAPENMFIGILIALICAFGWGFEGCVAGHATSMIDYEIAVLIRQITTGLAGLFILVPLFAIIGGDISQAIYVTGRTVTDMGSMPIFLISGFFALFAFSLWYKGNSMCGTALGMAANGAYSFWGPFFCWVILGLFLGFEGMELSAVAWGASVLMFVGILFIAVNPFSYLKKKEVA